MYTLSPEILLEQKTLIILVGYGLLGEIFSSKLYILIVFLSLRQMSEEILLEKKNLKEEKYAFKLWEA